MDYSIENVRKMTAENRNKWDGLVKWLEKLLFKLQLSTLKKGIKKAAKDGLYICEVKGNFEDNKPLLKQALQDMGYKVSYKTAYDRWHAKNVDIFYISWEEKDDV